MKNGAFIEELERLESDLLGQFGAPLDRTTSSGLVMAAQLASDPAVRAVARRLIEIAAEQAVEKIRLTPQADRTYLLDFDEGSVLSIPVPELVGQAIVESFRAHAGHDLADEHGTVSNVALGAGGALATLHLVPGVFGTALWLKLFQPHPGLAALEQAGLSAEVAAQLAGLLAAPPAVFVVAGQEARARRQLLSAAASVLASPTRHLAYLSPEPFAFQTELSRSWFAETEALHEFLTRVPGLDIDLLILDLPEIDGATAALVASLVVTGQRILLGMPGADLRTAVQSLAQQLSPDLLSSVIGGVAAVEQVNRLCRHCRRSAQVPTSRIVASGWPGDLEHLRQRLTDLNEFRPHDTGRQLALYRAVGCDQCARSGYAGELLLAELLLPSPTLRRQLAAAGSEAALGQLLTDETESGLTLPVLGLRAAKHGHTSVTELQALLQRLPKSA